VKSGSNRPKTFLLQPFDMSSFRKRLAWPVSIGMLRLIGFAKEPFHVFGRFVVVPLRPYHRDGWVVPTKPGEGNNHNKFGHQLRLKGKTIKTELMIMEDRSVSLLYR